jgi:hypothetical protein
VGLEVGPWHSSSEWFGKVPTAVIAPAASPNQATVSVFYPPGTLQLNGDKFDQFEKKIVHPPPQLIQQQFQQQPFFKPNFQEQHHQRTIVNQQPQRNPIYYNQIQTSDYRTHPGGLTVVDTAY